MVQEVFICMINNVTLLLLSFNRRTKDMPLNISPVTMICILKPNPLLVFKLSAAYEHQLCVFLNNDYTHWYNDTRHPLAWAHLFNKHTMAKEKVWRHEYFMLNYCAIILASTWHISILHSSVLFTFHTCVTFIFSLNIKACARFYTALLWWFVFLNPLVCCDPG